MSHTPGPWTLNGPAQFANPQSGAMVYAPRGPHGNGHLVAEIPFGYSDNQQDNAKLIAAAPELLKALIALCESHECMSAMICDPSTWDSYDKMILPRWLHALEIVKKAKGEK